uniref:Uncharacterized protein n=1 Tax=Solanum lycopersicum TaxID=4081 RepID=A0A3Q7ETS8_SOLLC
MPTGYIDKIRQNVILSKIPHENNLTINTHKQVQKRSKKFLRLNQDAPLKVSGSSFKYMPSSKLK